MVTTAIIAAAGQGKRMQCGINKVFLQLEGMPVLCHTIAAFESCPGIDQIVVVTGGEDVQFVQQLVMQYQFHKVEQVIAGGKERQDSVYNALCALSPVPDIVLVHDGARPFVDSQMIEKCLQALDHADGAVAAVPVKDTVKQADGDGCIEQTPERERLWLAQTPQVFSYPILKRAYEQAQADHYTGTDDASLVERSGAQVKLVMGSYQNFKITTPDDLLLAECQLNQGGKQMIRTGIGYDVHAFIDGRPLMLGGVHVPYEQGLLGHSDADVLIHAIMDALLGAAGLGDIGRHFPDSDAAYHNIASVKLLRHVEQLLHDRRCDIQNVDAVVVAQKPKLAAYIPAMTEIVARTLGLDMNQINIKATTTEGLGFAGRREGIAAYATATLRC